MNKEQIRNERERRWANLKKAQQIPDERLREIYKSSTWKEARRGLESFGLDLQGKEEISYKKGWEEWARRGPKHEGVYVPPPDPPLIIQVYREKMKEYQTAELVDQYFKFMDKIHDLKLSEQERMNYCLLSLPLLEPLIKNTLEEYGWFDLTIIPALKYAIDNFIANHVKGQLLNIRDIVNYFPELRNWRIYLEENLEEAGLSL